MQAITAASAYLGGKYLETCELYVTLEPCLMCAAALYWAQLGNLIFGATDEKRGYQLTGSRVLHPKTLVTSGILKEECSKLMSDFFKEKRVF